MVHIGHGHDKVAGGVSHLSLGNWLAGSCVPGSGRMKWRREKWDFLGLLCLPGGWEGPYVA